MANPDYSAIKDAGYSIFKAKPIDSGWNHEPDSAGLWRSYREGIKCGVIVPQLHGTLHFSPDEWLLRLRQSDSTALKAFDLQMIGEKEVDVGIGTQSMGPIYYADSEVIQQRVTEGIKIFKRTFRQDSITTIAPCYGWRSPETERAFLPHNIVAMQGREFQHLPSGGMKLHFLGERGFEGMLYLVRNCILEPVTSKTTMDQCIAQISRSFQNGLPAVLCSHRINYTSRVATKARDKGLQVLDGVLKRVTKLFPDVEFLSSDKLALRILEESQIAE